MLIGALNGESKIELLKDHYSPTPGYWERHPLATEITEIASGSFKRKNPPEVQGRGYVVATLEAALWAFYHHEDFRSGCLAVGNRGAAADTTGALYGQLAGAFYGEAGIPAEWRQRLTFHALIVSYSERLYAQRP